MIEEILKEFEEIPLCYDDGILENENDGEFIRGESHFKQHIKVWLSKKLQEVKNLNNL